MMKTPVNMIRAGMGTENSACLIAALIRMARPRTVVEIGAGDSTIFIADALQLAVQDWCRDRDLLNSPKWQERTALLDPTGIPQTYQPKLFTIDDFTAEGSSAEDAWNSLRSKRIDESIVTFIQRNFFSLDASTIASWGPIDIAWIDAGTPADDVRFVAALWEHIAPGGYLCLHEPTILSSVSAGELPRVRRIRAPVWEDLFRRLDDSFELITLPELHKSRQSGLGIARKRQNSERQMRAQSLQSELIELGEIPIRSNYLPIGQAALNERLHRDAMTAIMTSRDARSIYSAIVLGAKTVSDIRGSVDIDLKTINKIVSRLLSLGLVRRDASGLADSDEVWKEHANQLDRNAEDLSDRQLESPEAIEKIATAFAADVIYTEAEVSRICELFTTDYARLRRYLVDHGLLRRENNVYQYSER
jgi:predicted O-methyltransferase YrrM